MKTHVAAAMPFLVASIGYHAAGRVAAGPTVELLHVPDCPNGSAYLPHLRVLLAGTGARLVARMVGSAAQAERERFVGSPTVRVDGVDVEPDLTAARGLACRLYRTGEGVAGVPPDAWIVAAVEFATGRRRR